MMWTRTCNRKGFTQTEVLAAIAMVALLLAIAIPVLSFRHTISHAKGSVPLINARTFYGRVVNTYLSDGRSAAEALQEELDGYCYTDRIHIDANGRVRVTVYATPVSGGGDSRFYTDVELMDGDENLQQRMTVLQSGETDGSAPTNQT